MAKRGPKQNLNRFPDDAHDVMVNKQHFESLITKEATGCWHHNGPKHRQGYAFSYVLRKSDQKIIQTTAHRVSYRLYKGPLTLPNVNHTCGDVTCVNPAHLYNGTQAQNVHDTVASGRHNPIRKPYKSKIDRRRFESKDPNYKPKAKQARTYKYSDEDIQFGRYASLDDIMTRFNKSRIQARGFRYECQRLYKWLPWPDEE